MDLPSEFVARICAQMPDSRDFLAAIETQPACSVRLNPNKTGEHNLSLAEPIEWCDGGFFLPERPSFTLNSAFHAGLFYPQEASSMFLWSVLQQVSSLLPSNPIALDLCAAPGGKSTLISSYLNGGGVLVSNEIVRQRAWILRENIAKWGATNSIVTNLTPKAFGQLGAVFDLVVVDAPCSGEGMFRKDEAARSEWTPQNAEMCAARQRTILDDVWPSVVEGGVVIYSTCTFNPAENELNMQWLADEYDLEFLSIPCPTDATKVSFAAGEGYAFYPHKTRGEGFFVCAMRKLSGKQRKADKKLQRIQRQAIPAWIAEPDKYEVCLVGDDVVALPVENEAVMRSLAAALNPLFCGVPIGKKVRNEVVPAEELPLSQAFASESFTVVQLSNIEALNYLRGEWTANIPAASGWNVVRSAGANLGFVKVVGTRVNNYYPKPWRIKMKI